MLFFHTNLMKIFQSRILSASLEAAQNYPVTILGRKKTIVRTEVKDAFLPII